jgi:DNA invertase Pin-like site-specific DNA recombinase
LVANVMATFSQFERRLIEARTKEALAVRRSQGVRLGRPPKVDPSVMSRALALRGEGLSYARIAMHFDTIGVPTAHGGKRWYPNTVRQLILKSRGEDAQFG